MVDRLLGAWRWNFLQGDDQQITPRNFMKIKNPTADEVGFSLLPLREIRSRARNSPRQASREGSNLAPNRIRAASGCVAHTSAEPDSTTTRRRGGPLWPPSWDGARGRANRTLENMGAGAPSFADRRRAATGDRPYRILFPPNTPLELTRKASVRRSSLRGASTPTPSAPPSPSLTRHYR